MKTPTKKKPAAKKAIAKKPKTKSNGAARRSNLKAIDGILKGRIHATPDLWDEDLEKTIPF